MATKNIMSHGFNDLKSDYQNLEDTSLKFFDLSDFLKRVKAPNPHLVMEKLRDCGLVEAAAYPTTVQVPELIYECIAHYNLEMK